ncbi:MAG: hypothetical protein AMXMBFR45_07670 [Gammaproteobacteria bacterium]|nr:MAG: VPEID-CTERM sorting domain-containing protein [Pseudomonadota bacterium]MBC6945067.1 VPEID-CTERM sorting domain-containing protein [Gammaproteobacteria bacterium]MCE7896953.1 VPEID-CTERM sorting domain-containing protein [Gammaproteobacteria bacterium PRO8]MDL1879780.1 VPEID-CTERM sorting domain-containing protein [Gammaproteobacteria bacterium PRO2]MCL4776965.1 VPEID-CTERM sorting domain-containing protein [Gammaproteobacteria bacterium]
MKRSILGVAAALSLLAIAGPASAQSSNDWQDSWQNISIDIDRDELIARFCEHFPQARRCNRPPVHAVPEIDATSGTQALALVLGGALLGAEALRRRRSAARNR